MLTGRDVDAAEAERIGLMSRVVPENQLLDTCHQLAERIAAFSRPGIELTKRSRWSGLDAASLEGTCSPRAWVDSSCAYSPRTLKKR